jgi:hypothetical protein
VPDGGGLADGAKVDGGAISDGVRAQQGDALASDMTVTGGDMVPLSVGDDGLDLDCVVVGGEGSLGVQLENKGTQALGPLMVRLGGDGGPRLMVGMDTCSNNSLAAGQKCSLVLLWHPLMPGTVTASLDVYAPPAGVAHFPVRASSRMAEPVMVVPKVFDFGLVKVGTMSAPTSFQVTNMTDLPARAPRPRLQKAELFQIASDTCSAQMLAPAASCTVAIRFAPTLMGPASETLIFEAGSACQSDGSATLSGAGVP